MEYMIKSIETADLEKFLLNPFERLSYYEKNVIQKYPVTPDIDHLLFVDNTNYMIDVGFIVYNKQKILIDKIYRAKITIPEKDPFILMSDMKELIRKELLQEAERLKLEKLEALKTDKAFKEKYEAFKRSHFDELILSRMGGSGYYPGDYVHSKFLIRQYIMDLHPEDIAKFISDETMKDSFFKELIDNEDFKIADVFQYQMQKDAEEYIKLGKYTDKQKAFIDYVSKTTGSDAKRFLVKDIYGNTFYCLNEITCRGEIPLEEDSSRKIKLEEIENVKYRNKILYKK